MNPHEQVWDLLVVGGGTAGLVGAQTAAALGARVLLVERHRTGGDCLWTGCVPSKAFVAAATRAAHARDSSSFGVVVDDVRVDFAGVMGHVRRAVERIAPEDSPEALRAAGVEVLAGDLEFTGPGTAEVAGATIRFRQVLLATGAAPVVPPVPGLADVDHLTSETLWDLQELPRRLLVLGGGSTGCELGQAMARLGSEVVLVERSAQVLPAEDPVAAAVVRAAMEADGVDVRTGRTGVRVVADPGDRRAGTLVLDDGGEVGFDRLLVVVGRAPRTGGLGLDRLQVRVGEDGAPVLDRSLRTSNPRVWAAGDVTSHPRFTHVAGVHASTAASNAVLGLHRRAATSLPRVTFTQPELAAVGAATGAVRRGHRLLEWSHDHLDRAVADGTTSGTTRIAVDRRGRVVGATVVGPRAGETLGEIVSVIAAGRSLLRLASVVHAYPTYDDGFWNVAVADARRQVARPGVSRAAAAVVGLRRRWLDR